MERARAKHGRSHGFAFEADLFFVGNPDVTQRCEMTTRDLASPSRRRFLTATTAMGGALLLGFDLPARSEVRGGLNGY
jgi:hypothetical protein